MEHKAEQCQVWLDAAAAIADDELRSFHLMMHLVLVKLWGLLCRMQVKLSYVQQAPLAHK